MNVWDADLAAADDGQRGLYVAISGNTAAGKSSLITELERRLCDVGVPAVGISERIFHHQYLRLMFSNPTDFAFPIQLSFLLQRHLVLLRNLVSLRRTVIMERSHFDDVLFVDEHVREGNITTDQREAYESLTRVLHSRIPIPDVLVLLNPTPELSLSRLALAEARGDRPKEFPSEQAKEGWVRRWHAMYVDLHQRYRGLVATSPKWASTTLIDADPAEDRVKCADTVYDALMSHRERAG